MSIFSKKRYFLCTLLLIVCASNLSSGPLHNLIARSNAHVDEVQQFIERHPESINDRANNNWTPLHTAAHWGHAHIAEILINKNVDLNATCRSSGFGATALGVAVRGLNANVVALLLNAGARWDLEKFHDTPKDLLVDAAYAAQDGSVDPLRVSDTVDTLLQAGYHVSEQAFQASVNWCDITVIRRLMRRGNFIKRLGECRTRFEAYPELLEEMLNEVSELSDEDQNIIEANITKTSNWSAKQREAMIAMVRRHGVER